MKNEKDLKTHLNIKGFMQFHFCDSWSNRFQNISLAEMYFIVIMYSK